MLKHLKQALYPTVSRYFSHSILAEGILKGSDQSFKCLFVDNSLHAEYILSKMYNEPPSTLRRRIWIPALEQLIKNAMKEMDLIVVVLPNRYKSEFHGLYNFKGQHYVRQIIDTSGTWEEIKGRLHNKKKRFSNQMEKSCVSYRISHDLKDFDHFYYRMFIPHVSKQFGKLSIIDSYEDMKRHFLKGLLLFVMNGEQPIAGNLCMVEDRTLISRRIAVLDGDESYIRSGMQSALYYFQITLAKELKLHQVDTMNSSSFLHDGIYRHKREWGASVHPDNNESINWVYFFIPDYSEKAVRFFEQNPVIVHTEQGLKVLVGVKSGVELSAETKKSLFNKYYSQGLKGLILLTPHSEVPLDVSWEELRETRQS